MPFASAVSNQYRQYVADAHVDGHSPARQDDADDDASVAGGVALSTRAMPLRIPTPAGAGALGVLIVLGTAAWQAWNKSHDGDAGASPDDVAGHDVPEDGQNDGRRVLFVDDSSMQLLLASHFAKGLGLDLVTAPSGEEALVLLEDGGCDKTYKAIVSDYHMDPGMTGAEFLARAKALCGPAMPPAIFSSSRDEKFIPTADGDLIWNPGKVDSLESVGKLLRGEAPQP